MVKKYKDCLFNNKIILKSRQRFKSDHLNLYTNKSIRLHPIIMMIRDCKHLVKLQRIHRKHMHSKYAKVSFKESVKYK